MTNIFDQFDTEQANEFDQFDNAPPQQSLGENVRSQPFIPDILNPLDPLEKLGIPYPAPSEILPDMMREVGKTLAAGVGHIFDAPTDISNYLRGSEPGMPNYEEPTFRGYRSEVSPVFNPEAVPTGMEIKNKTGLPEAVATPVSGVLKAGAGLGQFMTTPAGFNELVVAATPVIGLFQKAKWVADMAEGAGQSLGNLSADAEDALRTGKTTPEQRQRMAEDTAQGLLMLYGAGKLSSHEISQLTGIREPLGRILESDKTRASKDLAALLYKEQPASGFPIAPPGLRQLGIRIPEGEFAQPGILPLADAALNQRMGANILAPGQEPALPKLRRALNPPEILPAGLEPRQLPPRQAGETVIQPSIEGLQVKPGFERTASDMLQERDRTGALVGKPEFLPEEKPNNAPGAGSPNPKNDLAKIRQLDREILDLKRAKVLDPELRTEVKQQRIQEKIDAKMRELFKLNEQEALIEKAVREQHVRQEPIQSQGEVPGEGTGGKNIGEGKPKQTWREDLQAWADEQIREPWKVNSIPDPALLTRKLTAFSIKGALLIERGLKNFKEWSVEMVRQFGDSIKPHLDHIWNQANEIHKGGQNAIYKTGPQLLRPLREEPVQSQVAVPAKDSSKAADVGGGQEGEAKAEEVTRDSVLSMTGDEYWKTSNDWSKEAMKGNGNGPQIRAEVAALKDPDLAKWKAAEETAKLESDKIKAEITADPSKLDKLQQAWIGAAQKKAFFTEGREILDGTKQPDPRTIKQMPEPTVESVTPLEPASGSPISPNKAWFEKADTRLAEIQKAIRGGKSFTGLTGVEPMVADAAITLARGVLNAGGTIAKAIDAAISYLRKHAKKFDEEAAIRMFEDALRENPAGKSDLTSLQTQETQPGVVTPKVKIKPPTIEDIYKIFEAPKKKKPSLKQWGINIVESFRTGISSKFRPINKLAEDIAKAYGLTSKKDIAGILEQLKGSQGKAEADIYRFDRDVSDLVKGDEKDFNAYMFLRRALDRLNQDMNDIESAVAGKDVKALNRRAVAQHTINSLTPTLEALQSKLGKEKVAKFEEAADGYQRHLDQALRLQVESGRMSSEVYDAIKAGNQFYAPFKLMKYVEESMRPPGSGRRVDTTANYTKAMTGIEDPNFKLGDMLAAARQNISMSRILADKNNAMRAVAELAAFDSDGLFIRKLKPGQEAPKGMDTINVIENGRKERYAVDTKVAETLQMTGGNAGGILTRFLGFTAVPFRAGATALNLPFQVSNLVADVPRQALVSKYGLRGFNDLWKYPAGFLESLYASMTGDVFGKKNKLMLDFLDSGVAGTTIQEYLTPEGLRFKESGRLAKGKKLANSVLFTVPNFAQAIEQTSKILGVKRAMEFHGVTSGKELAAKFPEAITELRRFSGSPDFGRTGKAVEVAKLNLLYMFLNARIQGAVSDVGRLSGRDGSKLALRTWRNLTIAVGVPTALNYWLNHKKGNKEDYDKIPARERQNYWHIPKNFLSGEPRYITTDDGERIRDYWRIPKRESSKWIANFTESGMDFAQKRNPKAAKEFGASMIQELSPVNIQGDTVQERLESVASGLHPFIKSPLELGTGRDLYRHKAIVPDQMQNASPEEQYKPSTAEAYKLLAKAMPDVAPEFLRSPLILENLTKNMTAGLITQFLPRKPMEGRSKVENFPLMSRFQAAPYTDNEQFQTEMQGLKREAADEQLNRHRQAVKLLDDNKGKTLAEVVAKAPRDARLWQHVVDLWVAKEHGITYRERQLLALPVRQRASWVAEQLKGLSPVEQQDKIMELSRKRILTEGVYDELPNFMKP